MAISKNLYTYGLSGTVGKIMTFTQKKSGKVILGKNHTPTAIPATAAQLDVRSKFKIASIYAKAAIKNPVLKAEYEAATQDDQSAYNVALRDAFKAPEITNVDTASYLGNIGDTITVRAIDDFRVASVWVEITSANGGFAEGGYAVLQENGLDWLYTAVSDLAVIAGATVTAKARDLPANETVKEMVL
jgi:hypothetical protein